MESVSCILCSCENYTLLSKVSDRLSDDPQKYNIVKCKCGMVFLNPRPNNKEISEYYKSSDYDPHNNKNTLFSKLYKIIQAYMNYRKLSIINKYTYKDKHLDIGCGMGEFGKYMSLNGWSVTLQDEYIDKNNFLNINKFDISVTQSLESLENKKFNLITLQHSLEHIHGIDKLFDSISKLITRDGILVISVPNFNAAEKYFYKEDWAPYDPPRHLYHFTRQTLESLLEIKGYRIIKTYSLIFDTPYNILLSIYKPNLYQYIKSMIILIVSWMIIALRGSRKASSIMCICKRI